MSEVIYAINCSLDGYIEDSDGSFNWSKPSAELHQFYNDLMRPITTSIYGRKLYETMAVWDDMPLEDAPDEIVDFAMLWRASTKFVVSSTLGEVSADRTTIERSFDPVRIQQIVDTADGDVAIGGAELAGHAFSCGLVDRIALTRLPVIVGGGKSVLPPELKLDLELLRQTTFPTGEVHTSYRVLGRGQPPY
jgi:dihydrofolate reductase